MQPGGPPAPPSGRAAPPRRPPPPKPAPPPKPVPKAFEIRRGRRSSDDGEALPEEGDEEIGHVVLPRSITQEAEEDSLKRRFNTDTVPDLVPKAPILQVAQSAGEGGPDRSGRQRRLALLILLVFSAVGAAAWWLSKGQ